MSSQILHARSISWAVIDLLQTIPALLLALESVSSHNMANLQEIFKNVLWHGHEFEGNLAMAIQNSRDVEDWEKLISIVTKTEEVMQQSKLEIQKRYPPSRPSSMQYEHGSFKSTTSTTHTAFSSMSSDTGASVNPPIPLSKGFESAQTNKPNQGSAGPRGNNLSGNQQNAQPPRNQENRPANSGLKKQTKKIWLEDGQKTGGDSTKMDKFKNERDPQRIFLPNISLSTTDNNLRSAFGHYGKIREARVFKNQDGSPFGRGIVCFEAQETVTQLMHKTFVVDGAEVKVSPFYTKPKPEKPTIAQNSKMTETLTETSSSHKIDPSAKQNSTPKTDTSNKCMICKTSKSNCILLWCGHNVVCSGCGGKLKVCPKPGCGQAIEKVAPL